MVRVKVKLFAAPGLALESRELHLELDESATMKDILDQLPLKDKSYLYMVREGIKLNADSRLNDGDEVLVFPPIAGG